MKKHIGLLAASILAYSTLSIAVEPQIPSAGEKQASQEEATKPGTRTSGPKAKKAIVPETQKDRENKKKCRGMGGSWQLGHCNVG